MVTPKKEDYMFVKTEDYKVVIGEPALAVLTRIDPATLSNAEAEAREEISSYLRPKYDCSAIFAAEGAARNPLIVMYTVDIALYHLSASTQQRMGAEVRKERYERATKWLEGVARGMILPDLPLAGGSGTDGSSPSSFSYGCQKKQTNNW